MGLTIPLDILPIYSPSITLNLGYISNRTSVEQSKYFRQTSFLDLNIKVIGNDVQTSVYDKRDFGIPIVYFPWSSCDVPRLPSSVFTFLSWLDLLGAVLAFWISILKIFKSLPHYWHMVIDITSFEKNIWKVLQVILGAFIQIWWNIVSRISFWRNPSPGLLLWSSQQTMGVKCEANFLSSGSKIVKRLRLRKYDPVINEWTWPFYSLVQIFSKA